MRHLEITSIPNRKRRAIAVYDDETNVHHVIAYITGDEELLIDTLTGLTEFRVFKKEESE